MPRYLVFNREDQLQTHRFETPEQVSTFLWGRNVDAWAVYLYVPTRSTNCDTIRDNLRYLEMETDVI